MSKVLHKLYRFFCERNFAQGFFNIFKDRLTNCRCVLLVIARSVATKFSSTNKVQTSANALLDFQKLRLNQHTLNNKEKAPRLVSATCRNKYFARCCAVNNFATIALLLFLVTFSSCNKNGGPLISPQNPQGTNREEVDQSAGSFINPFAKANIGKKEVPKVYDADDFFQLCANGSAREIQAAIDKGKSPNATDEQGFSPLFFAVLGRPALYQECLAKMKNALKTDNDDEFYLQKSLCPPVKGNLEAVKTLIKNGGNVRLPDKNKNTPFLYAALFCKDADILNLMIKAGADLGEIITVTYPASILSFASFLNSSPQCIECLCKATDSIDWKNKFGTTAIMWAAMYQSNPDVIDTLVRCGADINDKSHKDGYTPLYWAQRCNRNSQVIAHIKSIGGKTFNPQYAVAVNDKFSFLKSDKVFIGAATTAMELEYMIEKAHEFRKTQYSAPNPQEVTSGLETQAVFNGLFEREKNKSDYENLNHYRLTYANIKKLFDWYRLSVDDEGALYYVLGANTKPYFYTDKNGAEHLRNGISDYKLEDNPDYFSSSWYYSGYKDSYRYTYYDKDAKKRYLVDPRITSFYAQGYVLVFEVSTGRVYSDWQNGAWK